MIAFPKEQNQLIVVFYENLDMSLAVTNTTSTEGQIRINVISEVSQSFSLQTLGTGEDVFQFVFLHAWARF
jgi:hypothetical protein